MIIHIATIPHVVQRYPTVGDYWEEKDPREILPPTIEIRVSEMFNEDYNFLVALHELVEQHLVRKRGIPIEDIDAFDVQFEKSRAAGLVRDDAEPGDDPRAPYRREHQFATQIEKLMAEALGVDWKEYDAAVMSL